MRTGVYTITSSDGHRYVGSSANLPMRWGGHRHLLRRGAHPNHRLQAAWNESKETAFVFSVLLYCARSDLLFFEQRAIDCLRPEHNLVNYAGSTLGMVHTQEARRKIAQAGTGREASSETRARISEARKGMVFTPEHCLNISLATKGKPKSAAGRIGKPLSAGHREAISAAMRGRPKSPETRAKMLAARRRRMTE